MRAMERQEKIHFDKYNLTNTFYKYILRNTFGQIHLDKFISPNTFLRTCLFLCFIVYDVRWGTIHYKSIYSNSLAQQLSWWKPNCFVCVIILKHMRLSLYCHTLFVSFVNLVFSCPEQLNRWPCHWLTHSLTHSLSHWVTDFYFCHTKSNPRDLQPLRHLIRVMRRHDLTEKDIFWRKKSSLHECFGAALR